MNTKLVTAVFIGLALIIAIGGTALHNSAYATQRSLQVKYVFSPTNSCAGCNLKAELDEVHTGIFHADQTKNKTVPPFTPYYIVAFDSFNANNGDLSYFCGTYEIPGIDEQGCGTWTWGSETSKLVTLTLTTP
jgi:hypothetical protein